MTVVVMTVAVDDRQGDGFCGVAIVAAVTVVMIDDRYSDNCRNVHSKDLGCPDLKVCVVSCISISRRRPNAVCRRN